MLLKPLSNEEHATFIVGFCAYLFPSSICSRYMDSRNSPKNGAEKLEAVLLKSLSNEDHATLLLGFRTKVGIVLN